MGIVRSRVNGTLFVDDQIMDTGQATGRSSSIDGLEKFYLGGVPEGFNSKRVPVSGYLKISIIYI